MDLQTLQFAYDSLPPLAKRACAKVGAAVLGRAVGGAWKAVAQKTHGAAFAGGYRQWLEDLLEAEADDRRLAAAFEEFFCRPPTVRELDKLLRDQYADVDFQVPEQQLRESCEWAGCPAPRAGLHEQLDSWVRSLKTNRKSTRLN